MSEKIEVIEEEVVESGSSLLAGVRRVLMAGVGAVALAQEEVEEFVKKLVDRGEIAEKDGRKLVDDIMEKRKSRAQKAEDALENRIEGLLDRMNVPTKSDIDDLSKKITLLAEKVDELKSKKA
ncbi:MAG: phasin family protein [Ardenticatenaceae bacterium]|nr:phasin family protein [Ardenticatenaceae bacterium]MCB9443830.1 phasin family protein [Ardenticatenaceae bacterium]